MHIYFVRHGESMENRSHTHQPPSTPLSPRGAEQARTIAEELRALNPTLLITSDFVRTKETAGIIGNNLGLTPRVSTLFHEIRRPTALYGKSHFHPETFVYVLLSILHRDNRSWHMKDAENFTDIKIRIDHALNFLEAFEPKHESIVVVSHTMFINLLSAYMCHDRNISFTVLFPYLSHILRMRNVEITHLMHNRTDGKNVCAWSEGAYSR